MRADGRISVNTEVTSYSPVTIRSVITFGFATNEDNGFYECRVTSRDQVKKLQFEVRILPKDGTYMQCNTFFLIAKILKDIFKIF